MSGNQISETTQLLTFTLGEEVFAVDIAQVREVLEYSEMTKVPRTPEYMRGVINLRGHVVPVVDMRLKFGMNASEITVNTCVIIVEVSMGEDSSVLGAMVDSVKEVLTIEPQNVEPPPRMGTRLNTNFIRGMGKQEDGFVIILDADRVFSSDELTMLQQVPGGGAGAMAEAHA